MIADDAYRSILRPRAETVAGYKPIMPSYAKMASTEHVDALIAYIKSLPSQEASP